MTQTYTHKGKKERERKNLLVVKRKIKQKFYLLYKRQAFFQYLPKDKNKTISNSY